MSILAALAVVAALSVAGFAAFFTVEVTTKAQQFKPPKGTGAVFTCRDFRRATVRWPCHGCGTLTTIACDRCDWPVCPGCREVHEAPSKAYPHGRDFCRTCKVDG